MTARKETAGREFKRYNTHSTDVENWLISTCECILLSYLLYLAEGVLRFIDFPEIFFIFSLFRCVSVPLKSINRKGTLLKNTRQTLPSKQNIESRF